jgi:hypothetical protein
VATSPVYPPAIALQVALQFRGYYIVDRTKRGTFIDYQDPPNPGEGRLWVTPDGDLLGGFSEDLTLYAPLSDPMRRELIAQGNQILRRQFRFTPRPAPPELEEA